MNNTMEQEVERLEKALRENVAGKPQVLLYDHVTGNMSMTPVRKWQESESQFGLLNRDAMTQDFGFTEDQPTVISEPADTGESNIDVPTYSYDCATGDMIETSSSRSTAPSTRGFFVEGQFGTLLSDSFTSSFGCDVAMASITESALDMGGANTAQGFAYTLENEGVVRIVREADPLAKGSKDNVVFARKGEAASVSVGDARFVVLLDGIDGVSVVEKTTNGERTVPTVELIPDRSGMYTLGTGLLESPSLKDTSIMLLGCGSMGCDIAMHMAMAGVGKIILADPDRVEASNLSRLREAIIADVGRRKVDMLGERILGKNPSCEVVKVCEDITKNARRMGTLLANSDVAVVSTDNRASRVLFAHALHAVGKPCIFTRCSTRAESGDCFISRPGEACYECLYGTLGVGDDEVDDWTAAKKAGRLAAYCTPESMHDFAILPGISADISSITSFASRLALWELAKTREDDQFTRFNGEFSAFNFFLFVNRREKFFKNDSWAPFDKSENKPCPQRWYGAKVPKRDDCACCGNQECKIDTGNEDARFLEKLCDDATIGEG